MIEEIRKGLLKEINRELKRAYGTPLPKDLIYFRRGEKVYGVRKEVKELLGLKGLRIENIGIRILNMEKDGIRLTIEGAQIVGKNAKKNIFELPKELAERFLSGEDIEMEGNFDYPYIIVKSGEDVLGVGRIIKGNKLRPYIPKERRIPGKYVK